MPVSKAVQELAGDRVEPVDLIHGLDLLDDDTFESLLRLASSGRIGAALAAPYCCKHSRATLRPMDLPQSVPRSSLMACPLTRFSSKSRFKKARPSMTDRESCYLQLIDMQA